MKKWGLIGAIVFLIAAIIVGCSPDKEQIQSEFTVLLEETATPVSMMTATAYLDKNIGKAGPEIGSQMLMSYEDYMLRYLNTDADWVVIGDLYAYWDTNKAGIDETLIQSDETKALYENLLASSFKFATSEGMVYPVIDYKVIIEKYGKEITEALNGLYAIKQFESDSPSAMDAALVIGWDELLNRAYSTEQFIQQNKEDTMVLEDAQFIYENYINFVLLGLNNTPIFDYQTTEFNPEARNAYQLFFNTNPETVTGWMIGEYMNYLSGIGYKMDYNDETVSKAFFDTCSWLVSEAGKKVIE